MWQARLGRGTFALRVSWRNLPMAMLLANCTRCRVSIGRGRGEVAVGRSSRPASRLSPAYAFCAVRSS
eukprot:4898643-Heterocapsa_arctica.AAC.1